MGSGQIGIYIHVQIKCGAKFVARFFRTIHPFFWASNVYTEWDEMNEWITGMMKEHAYICDLWSGLFRK